MQSPNESGDADDEEPRLVRGMVNCTGSCRIPRDEMSGQT